jgi:hypothetical protein
MNNKLLKVYEQIRCIESELEDFKNEVAELESQRREQTKKIFEIIQFQNYETDGFDWEGDNDILNINFGRRYCDVRRSVLTKSVIGWNMFSSLFGKKWDGFHVRDRKGRIYVDLREEWLRPLIDHLKRNLDSDDYIEGATFFTLGSLQFFNFQRIFEVDFAQKTFGSFPDWNSQESYPHMFFRVQSSHSLHFIVIVPNLRDEWTSG